MSGHLAIQIRFDHMTTHHPTSIHSLQAARSLFHLDHLTVVSVAGDDAGKFLQGQLTCNINELSDEKASIAAFCNAKGRAICTLLIVKTGPTYRLILPLVLADKVRQKLQMYILRSKVMLSDGGKDFKLLGLIGAEEGVLGDHLPSGRYEVLTHPITTLRLTSNQPKFLCIVDSAALRQLADRLVGQGYTPGDLNEWRYRELSDGLPWLNERTSEQFIPQMLNLDLLGGISFNKGCYTGQEIIARTHYLGKTKRQMVVADCEAEIDTSTHPAVIDAVTREKVGEILASCVYRGKTRLQLIVQTVDGETKSLILDGIERATLTLTSE